MNKNEWINVKDKLPPYKKDILMAGVTHTYNVYNNQYHKIKFIKFGYRSHTNEIGEIYFAHNDNNKNRLPLISGAELYNDMFNEREITHWMSLPKHPYQK